MGNLILLDDLKARPNAWLLPADLVKFDVRQPPWPNELFDAQPSKLNINLLLEQAPNPHVLVQIRRFCEQQLEGDVVLEGVIVTQPLVLTFWFEHQQDKQLFDSHFAAALVV